MIKPEGTMKVITDYGEGLSETVPAVSVETAQKIADERDGLMYFIESLDSELVFANELTGKSKEFDRGYKSCSVLIRYKIKNYLTRTTEGKGS